MTTEYEKKQALEDFHESLRESARKLAKVAVFHGCEEEGFKEVLQTFGLIWNLVNVKTRPGIVLETCGGAMH